MFIHVLLCHSESTIFEKTKKLLVGIQEWWDSLPDFPYASYFHDTPDWLKNVILLCCLVVFLSFFSRKLRESRSLRNGTFFSLVIVCYLLGVFVYFCGYDYAGTSRSFIALLLRSMLSGFEMFLSKSNLIGIADNCKDDAVYMTLFAFVHALAIALSTFFAVACFWKRIKDWIRSKTWRFFRNDATYVFWGFNERSFMLARDIYKHRKGRERIIFVDFPDEKENGNKSQSFSGLIGLLSFKMKVNRALSDINYIMYRSSCRPSEVSDKVNDFFDELDLMRLKRILRRSDNSYHFIFTDNESSNLKAAVKMLQTEMFEDKEHTKLYCAVRKTSFSKLIEEKYEGQLRIIDDSRMAINALKRGEIEKSQPIDYVKVNSEKAVVESCFTSLIIGFGTTGQDALRFLYEFSALPDAEGNKSPVKIHVVDSKMNQLRGEFMQEVPSIEQLEDREIKLHHMDIGSQEFFALLSSLVKNLNYVVVAAGNDTLNIEIATSLLEMANQYKDENLEHFRVFVRLYNEESKVKFDEAIAVYKPFGLSLAYFGSTKSLYKKDIIISDRIKDEAEEFHRAYCEANAGETYVPLEKRLEKEKRKSGIGPLYAYRSMERKESQNKANRMHVYTKMKLMGMDNYPQNVVLPKWDDKFGFDKCKLDKNWTTKLLNASICEHLRWNASHLMMGYICMTDEVKAQDKGTCNIKKKMHACIVDWNQLDKQIQKYDYYVVKTSICQYLKGKVVVNIE